MQKHVHGNSATATKLQNKRTIAISGGATGTATGFDGTSNISIPITSIDPDNFSKVVPVSKGGTGMTSIAPQKISITKVSDVTNNSYIMYSPISRLCVFHIDFQTMINTQDSKTLGTIPQTYRPKDQILCMTDAGEIRIEKTGEIIIAPDEDIPHVFIEGETCWFI